MRVSLAALLISATAVACAPATRPTVGTLPAAAARPTPPSVLWTQRSAEHQVIFEQIYAGATRSLDSLAGGRSGGWAVILDADETVIDNSEYQRRRAEMDSAYTSESWTAWVAERAATPLPGAAAFLRHVRELGGRVVIVTNRNQVECDDTRANLVAVQLPTDLVLCRPDGPGGSDKNARFAAVRDGTADPALPPLEVVMWVGDNIQDFPGLDQSARSAPAATLALFGIRYILLPNPMYGSWEG